MAIFIVSYQTTHIVIATHRAWGIGYVDATVLIHTCQTAYAAACRCTTYHLMVMLYITSRVTLFDLSIA